MGHPVISFCKELPETCSMASTQPLRPPIHCTLQIAEESLRFLNLVVQRAMSPNGGGGDAEDNPMSTYETELSALHDSIGQLVQVMLTDSVNAVKQVRLQGDTS